MKRGSRRVLGLIMTLVMILVTVPLPELKVHAAEEKYGVWIGDKEFTSEQQTITGSKGSASYNPDNCTVTFNDFVNNNGDSGIHENSLLYVEKKGTGYVAVTLAGKATFSSEDSDVFGIFSDADLRLEIASGAKISFSTVNIPLFICLMVIWQSQGS
ncbi:MAG: hypothetical protein IK115_01020 [Lachnospiraceae bacterium]|nr:hypothetical protein [Lachnospiraceae bacterium]